LKKEYGFILIAYIVMQLSSFVVSYVGTFFGYSSPMMKIYIAVIWLVFSFTATLILVLFLLRKEMGISRQNQNAAPISSSFMWAVGGVFLALFAQGIAANIERLMGIGTSSENTESILAVIESFPIFILVSSIIGPILEEIVFRKIIFGTLYKKLNFFLSALISSLIFALAHAEIEHLLLYSAIGFTFAFLYVKTKRIIVPIFAHVSMNTFVVLVQSVYKDDIERMMRDAEKIQGFIGGLFT
jgi:membrane protease YdiL (CAAX protease family)